ncbi:MAG: SDR family oxidoreductase [Spirochaetaceae bacterium]|nr:MAG: SDR family oxidoreductase [Spirochaetaceae bacterium]
MLARFGVNVAINYNRSAEAAQELVSELETAGLRAVALQADLRDPDQAEQLVKDAWERLGPIDLLINNLGTYDDQPFLNMPHEVFDDIMSTNVRATYLLARAAGRRMKERGQGCIVNVAASDAYHRSHSVYGLAKQGVLYLTEALALELAPEVRINAVAPDLMADNEDLDPASDFARRSVAATPLGRLVRRDEVAQMICLLCSSRFDFVTGQVVGMDGGRSIHRISFG